MSARAAALVCGVLALALAGCARPGWLRAPDVDLPDVRLPDVDLPDVDMPTVDLPSFGSDGPKVAPAPDSGVEVLTDAPELEFHVVASEFYDRLTGRRFNSLTTFRDPALREFFESQESFSDYFADLAQDLADANFARNEPLNASVQEFLVDSPGRARVRVRMDGNNGLPLRFWSTSLVREDRWERRAGRWWIIPGTGEAQASTAE